MFELETGLIFWNTVSFGILVFIMYKWGLPPILAMLSLRQKTISDSMSYAEANQKKSEELLFEYKKKLGEASESASRMLKSSKSEAERARLDMLKQAEVQADQIIEGARQDLKSEKEKIIKEAKKEIADLVVAAASMVIGRTLSAEDNKKIIEEALQ
jgi:F-type H+-transporting ATPase subunit b